MEALWSYVADDGDVVDLSPGRRAVDELRRSGHGWVRRYAVLPSREDARWLIPLGSPRVAAAAFALHPPYRRRSRAAFAAAAMVARAGLPRWPCDTIVVASREPPWLERAISELVDTPCVLALARGGSAAVSKISAVAIAADGARRAFAKVARTPGRDAAVVREADALRRLAGRGVAPSLLGECVGDGTRVAVQSPLPGTAGRAAAGATEWSLLARLNSGSARPLEATTWMRELRASIATTPSADRPAFETLASRVSEVALPATVVHGDFAPWNVRVAHRVARAFDWEWWSESGPPFVDAAHHRLQSAFLLGRMDDEHAFDDLLALISAQRGDRPPTELLALCGLGVIAYNLRRREDGYSGEDLLARRYQAILARIVRATEPRL